MTSLGESSSLPQLACPASTFYLTDAGLETVMIFEKGIDLPHFASFLMLRTEAGRAQVREYKTEYLSLAKRSGVPGFILETCTWRANPVWAAKLDLTEAELAEIVKVATLEAVALRLLHEAPDFRVIVSGMNGPREDAYSGIASMTADEAQQYHSKAIDVHARNGVDMISAFTLGYPAEAVGIVRAATANNLPAFISFTVETDGRLPNGQSLREAIEEVDAQTAPRQPAYYGINCAHPSHFSKVVQAASESEDAAERAWLSRLVSMRCNPSCKSHAELDEATSLDRGDPVHYGMLNAMLKKRIPSLTVFGGCCGSNAEHIEQVVKALKEQLN